MNNDLSQGREDAFSRRKKGQEHYCSARKLPLSELARIWWNWGQEIRPEGERQASRWRSKLQSAQQRAQPKQVGYTCSTSINVFLLRSNAPLCNEDFQLVQFDPALRIFIKASEKSWNSPASTRFDSRPNSWTIHSATNEWSAA